MKSEHEKLMDEYLARGGAVKAVPEGRRGVRRSQLKARMRGTDLEPGKTLHWKLSGESREELTSSV